MFNLCLFIFIFYAVGHSAKIILFGSSKKRPQRTASKGGSVKSRSVQYKKHAAKPKITKIPLSKTGRTRKIPCVLNFLIKYLILMWKLQSKSKATESRRPLKSAGLPLLLGQSLFCLPKAEASLPQVLTS